MICKSYIEYITTVDNLEVWGSKYVFKTWFAPTDLINTRTGERYAAGDLCFVVISYIDSTGTIHYTEEEKNFEEIS